MDRSQTVALNLRNVSFPETGSTGMPFYTFLVNPATVLTSIYAQKTLPNPYRSYQFWLPLEEYLGLLD